jgi:protease I
MRQNAIVKTMELSGKTIAVLVDQSYQEMEVWYPIYRLQEGGATVVTFGPKAGEKVTSKLGYPVLAERSYADLPQASGMDGVIVPGGWAPDYIRRNETAVAFVAEMDRQRKLVAAVCHGPWVLCSAGILKGRRATSFFAIKADVVNAGAQWVDADAVRDANLVTSRKPEDLPAFMRACFDVLLGRD